MLSRLEDGLPNEPVEWKRSFGRTAKSVTIKTKFNQASEQFKVLANSSASGRRLIGHPVLHTFWTNCQDVDVYKASLKDELSRWLTRLKQVWGANAEWMIILVDIPEAGGLTRKSSKLLLQRTTVMDKIRSDFTSGKQMERCVTLIGTFLKNKIDQFN